MVQLLLEKGADVNAQGGSYGNALQATSLGGHESSEREHVNFQVLVSEGEDANRSVTGRHVLPAVQTKSYVRGQLARMRNLMLLWLGCLIGWYWRV